jgi:hypothetical protein
VIRVKAAFFSLTPPPAETEDISAYLRWHLLDHMPEQYQLPGIVYALRYVADGEYGDHLLAENGLADRVWGVMNYLVGDPVQQTHDDFMNLGPRLAEVGRLMTRPSLGLRMLALLRWYSAPKALVSPEVAPFRPHRGIAFIVEEPTNDSSSEWLRWLQEEHYPSLLDVAGVAGAWMYGSTNTWKLHPHCDGTQQWITLVYLDADPLETMKELKPVVEERWASGAARPLFAGPMRTMTDWEAWPR